MKSRVMLLALCLYTASAVLAQKAGKEKPIAQADQPEASEISPESALPDSIFYLRVKGKHLNAAETKIAVIPQTDSISIEPPENQGKDGSLIRVVLRTKADAVRGEYRIEIEPRSGKKRSFPFQIGETNEAQYISCPSTQAITARFNDTGSHVLCSQSILDANEASDIFGKRISTTYMVIQVNIRNLSDQFQYLVEDINLSYGESLVSGRDRRLARGVSEKGQFLDARNLVVHGAEAAGSIIGGVGLVSPDIDIKNAGIFIQSSLTNALKGFLPDFTVAQLNRLNDLGFAPNAVIVPEKSSITVVSFLSLRTFLTDDERRWFKHGKSHFLGLYKVKYNPKKMPFPERREFFQQNLKVFLTGAHITEIKNEMPHLAKLDPTSSNCQDSLLPLQILGSNLNRASRVSLRSSSGAHAEGEITLIQGDTGWAKVTGLVPKLSKGMYSVFLVDPIGKEYETAASFEITGDCPSP